VLRSETVPQRVPPGGLVVVRDGETVEETPILSPLAWQIEHRAEVEITVAGATPAVRNTLLDALLVDVGVTIAALARSAVVGPVNIGTGIAPALREVALEAARALGADPALLRFGAMPLRDGDSAVLMSEVTRLRDEVGFTPGITWQEGVARFAIG